MPDYYQVLGVPRDASTEDIKRAYRKLARQHHPDIAGPDADEEQFKLATRAYEVLSNDEKRRSYDMGVDPTAGASGNPFGAGGAGFGFQDIFDSFFGAGPAAQRGPIPRARRGQDSLLRMDLDLADVVFGTAKDVTVDTAVTCTLCHGTCCQPGTSPQTCTTCKGSGVVQRVAQTFLGQVMSSQPCPRCRGFGDTIPSPCAECSGEGRVRSRRTLSVTVPAGVETGTRIRMAGQGEVGPGGGPAGDLFVETRVRPHDVFSRDGDDLHARMPLPMTAAALGATMVLETLDGPQELTIRPGAQPESVVTLKGLGVGRLQRTGRGDLLVHLDVATPTDLSDDERALLAQLASMRGETQPEARLQEAGGGFFKRMRDAFTGK